MVQGRPAGAVVVRELAAVVAPRAELADAVVRAAVVGALAAPAVAVARAAVVTGAAVAATAAVVVRSRTARGAISSRT